MIVLKFSGRIFHQRGFSIHFSLFFKYELFLKVLKELLLGRKNKFNPDQTLPRLAGRESNYFVARGLRISRYWPLILQFK